MFPEQRDYRIADGAEQVRDTMRAQVKYGVDVIKILATGGVLSQGDSPGAPQYTLRRAESRGGRSAHGGPQDRGTRARSGRHQERDSRGNRFHRACQPGDDEDIRLAKEHGTYFVMDIYNDDYILGRSDRSLDCDRRTSTKSGWSGRLQRENFRRRRSRPA